MDEQRTAIVTGGGSGIGLAISPRLATDGHAVAVLDLGPEIPFFEALPRNPSGKVLKRELRGG